jgi:hypothetical protein
MFHVGVYTSVGGSLATTNQPAALTSASYDAVNELVNWSGTSLTYDANGNLAADGQHIYTWDARNRLSDISGATSPQYDAVGRRTRNPSGISFLYDGATA